MSASLTPPRRRFLQGAGAFALTGIAAASTPPARAQQRSKARIVIIGAGMAGLAMANRLHRELDGARITVIDSKREHNYQPGYTLVATGIWPVSKVRNLNQEFMPSGVDWITDMAAEIDPETQTVTTLGGATVPYDFLVVCPGLELNYGAIEGMDVAAIGQHGLGSVYASPDAAAATWRVMDTFRQDGGQAFLTLPTGPLKCAGAPLKMTFMLRDRLAQAGTLAASEVNFMSALPDGTVFGVPSVNQKVLELWQGLDIAPQYQQTLRAVDIPAREAVFEQADGSTRTENYDFLHVVPPMQAPRVVRDSALAWQDEDTPRGWLEVNADTLQHRRYPNVFGVGDVNGTPRGKTAATVKTSAPLVTENLLAVMADREPPATFNGYTSCPLLVREGAAMLIEFDYEGRLVPTIPGLAPLTPSYFGWFTKYALLKPAYLAALRGRV